MLFVSDSSMQMIQKLGIKLEVKPLKELPPPCLFDLDYICNSHNCLYDKPCTGKDNAGNPKTSRRDL